MIPTMKELMGEEEFPFPLGYVLERLAAEGIFAPWLNLNENGQVSTTKAKEVFTRWSVEHDIPKMAQPKDSCRPVHTAIRSFGGIHFFGGEDINLDEGASPFPPIFFGTSCTIRSGARLGGPLILGDQVQVGSSHVSRSVIFSRTRIASNATVGDSIIGPNVKIEAGVAIRSSTGRRAYDGTIVTRLFKAPRHEDLRTGRKILGAVIGRDCIVEADLEPGMVLMPGCHVRAWMKGLPRSGVDVSHNILLV